MRTYRNWALAIVALTALATLTPCARASDPKYLPSDTEWVFTFNIKQILDSPMVKAQKDHLEQAKGMLEAQLENNPAGKYIKDAGFNVFKDLHTVTFASAGNKEPDFVLVEGNFNVDKFVAAAEDAIKNTGGDVVKVTKSGKLKIFEITPPGEKRMFATLLNNKTMLACSTKEALDDAVARVGGTKKSTLKKEFKALLETTNSKQSMSFVATGAALAKMTEGAPIPNVDAANMVLQGIDGFSVAITVAKDIQFQLGINAKDEENAKKMAQIGNASLFFMRTLAAQKAKEDEKLAPIVDIAKTLRITSQGSNILLRGEATVDAIDKLMKNFQQ